MPDGSYRTFGIHVGCDKSLNWATLITDKVYLDFIIPNIKELSDWYGVRVKQNTNKTLTYKKVIDKILKDREQDINLRE